MTTNRHSIYNRQKESTLSQIKKYIISVNRAEIFAHKNEQVKSHLLILFYRAEMAFQRWLNAYSSLILKIITDTDDCPKDGFISSLINEVVQSLINLHPS